MCGETEVQTICHSLKVTQPVYVRARDRIQAFTLLNLIENSPKSILVYQGQYKVRNSVICWLEQGIGS